MEDLFKHYILYSVYTCLCSYAVNVGKEVIEWKFSNIPDDLMDGRMGSLLINYYGKLHCTVVAKFLFSCREVIFTLSTRTVSRVYFA